MTNKPTLPKIGVSYAHEVAPTPSESDLTSVDTLKIGRGGKGGKRDRAKLNYAVSGSHYERGVIYDRIKLSNGALLSIENSFTRAIALLDPNMAGNTVKTSEWCNSVVENWQGADLNNVAKVRCAVVDALMERLNSLRLSN